MEISRDALQDLIERAYAREIAKRPDERDRIRSEPDVYLTSLLLQIEEEVVDPRKAHHTPELVETSVYDSRMRRAREFLAQLSETAPSTPSN